MPSKPPASISATSCGQWAYCRKKALEDGFAGATIGMEFAGRVLQTGSTVGDLQPGDKVMGIGPAAFSTHVRVRRDGVTKLPETMETVAAATVPVAFLTAYYAMVELGHIQPGETILIHGAAGGVGLAALQIAKLKGAKVIATAGTIEKRRFLQMLAPTMCSTPARWILLRAFATSPEAKASILC